LFLAGVAYGELWSNLGERLSIKVKYPWKVRLQSINGMLGIKINK
jgi:hypothetical protein